MNTDTTVKVPAQLQPLAATGMLLERLDRLPRSATAAQYREVARKAQELLGQAAPGAELEALLAALPGLSELYENLNYNHAGLCRSPLTDSLNTELAARVALRRCAAP
jgi:molybdopterin converting factor small subunit